MEQKMSKVTKILIISSYQIPYKKEYTGRECILWSLVHPDDLLVPVLSALKLHINLNLITKKQERKWDSNRKNEKTTYLLSHLLFESYFTSKV